MDKDFFFFGSGGACLTIFHSHVTLKVKHAFCFCRYWISLFAPAQFVKSAPLSAAATLNRQGTEGVRTAVRRLTRIPQIRFPVRIPAVLSKVLNAPQLFGQVLKQCITWQVTAPSCYLRHDRPTKSASNCENVRHECHIFNVAKCWLIQSLLLPIGISDLRASFLWSCPSLASGIF